MIQYTPTTVKSSYKNRRGWAGLYAYKSAVVVQLTPLAKTILNPDWDITRLEGMKIKSPLPIVSEMQSQQVCNICFTLHLCVAL